MSTNKSNHPRTGPQCTATNSLGFRCNHNALDFADKCAFHISPLERGEAKIAKEAALEAAREAAKHRQPLPVPDYLLASTDNAQDFAKALLTSLEFCEYVAEGLRTRTIPPTLLIRLMDYAEGWGKPPDRIEHTGKNGEPVVSEIRRVIVHPREENDSSQPSEPIVDMQDEGLDVPLIPVQPRRMH